MTQTMEQLQEQVVKLKGQVAQAYEDKNRKAKVLALATTLISNGVTARQALRYSESDWQNVARQASFRYFKRVNPPGPSGETVEQIIAHLMTYERSVPSRSPRPIAVVLFA